MFSMYTRIDAIFVASVLRWRFQIHTHSGAGFSVLTIAVLGSRLVVPLLGAHVVLVISQLHTLERALRNLFAKKCHILIRKSTLNATIITTQMYLPQG